MMQHDLFTNPAKSARASYPFLVVLQAVLADTENRIVAPLIPLGSGVPRSRLLPVAMHEGQSYAVMMELIAHIPRRLLRYPIGSIAQYRDDLTRALDWLFFGI
jgi:hypothetical protein